MSNRESLVSHQTFTDTEISHSEAMKTMRIQSLSSIVNHPKQETLMKKLGKMVKDNIKGKKHMSSRAKFVYKPMTEQDVPDSLHIPKVNWPRDFTR